jgi:hypothetical protein
VTRDKMDVITGWDVHDPRHFEAVSSRIVGRKGGGPFVRTPFELAMLLTLHAAGQGGAFW